MINIASGSDAFIVASTSTGHPHVSAINDSDSTDIEFGSGGDSDGGDQYRCLNGRAMISKYLRFCKYGVDTLT
jgi:hypothetical protein